MGSRHSGRSLGDSTLSGSRGRIRVRRSDHGTQLYIPRADGQWENDESSDCLRSAGLARGRRTIDARGHGDGIILGTIAGY